MKVGLKPSLATTTAKASERVIVGPSGLGRRGLGRYEGCGTVSVFDAKAQVGTVPCLHTKLRNFSGLG